MEVSPYLVVRKLVLRGLERNYEAIFSEGLNVIWGDMDSGKSSILNLIDYCLGGKNKHLLYDEISAKARDVMLEVDLNGSVNTIIRTICEQSAPVQVYLSGIDGISDKFPMFMSADSVKEMPDGWLSDYILECLGIAKVRIKESGYREDADSDRLSFRDLMKLMYLRQTKIGADSLLDYGSSVFSKNVQVQKFVYNVHDDRLSSLHQELSRESIELAKLHASEISIKGFLTSVDISVDGFDSLNDFIDEKESKLKVLEGNISTLKSNHKFSSEVSVELSRKIFDLRRELENISKERSVLQRKYNEFVLLKNTYASDLESLNVSKLTRLALSGRDVVAKEIPCPLCEQGVSLTSAAISDEDIDMEIRSIKNRMSGAQQAVDSCRDKISGIVEREAEVKQLLEVFSQRIELENSDSISPLVENIEVLDRSVAEVKVELSALKRSAAIAYKFSDILARIDSKGIVIRRIKSAISDVEAGLIGLSDVVEKLSSLLRAHLGESGLQRANNIYVSDKFVPHFRGMSYYDASSGGVRTITSIAWFVTRLEYLLVQASNLPTFLMIDTPGQNIGRYSRDDDSEVSDPAVYEKIYLQILEVLHRYPARKCQVIVVDNDLPHSLGLGDYHLVKRFSKKGGEHEKGLISDY